MISVAERSVEKVKDITDIVHEQEHVDYDYCTETKIEKEIFVTDVVPLWGLKKAIQEEDKLHRVCKVEVKADLRVYFSLQPYI